MLQLAALYYLAAFHLTSLPLQSGGALSSLVFEYMIDKSKLGIDAGMAQVQQPRRLPATPHLTPQLIRFSPQTLCHALAEKEDDIFASCMQVPKEFWRLCNCAAPLLVRSDPKHASDTVRALFHAIGERIKAADAQYSAGLFNDYCLPKIAQTLRMQPSMCAPPTPSPTLPLPLPLPPVRPAARFASASADIDLRRSALLELSNAYVVPEMRLQVHPAAEVCAPSVTAALSDVQGAAVRRGRLQRVHNVPGGLRPGASSTRLSPDFRL